LFKALFNIKFFTYSYAHIYLNDSEERVAIVLPWGEMFTVLGARYFSAGHVYAVK